jgi:hypothetical protein
MKNIILQHFDGELRELDKLSVENISKYASRIGADYKLVLGKPFNVNLTAPCQKVVMLDEIFDKWDNVVMLDIDMFKTRTNDENIFLCKGIGLYEDTQVKLHYKLTQLYPNISSPAAPYWGGAIYKMNKEERVKLRQGLLEDTSWMETYNKPYHYEDEGIMHTLAVKTNFYPEHPYLDKKWCYCSFLNNPENAGFIHIRTKITPSGPKREKIENYKSLLEVGIL